MILAEKIVKLRKQVNWSQEELAHKMDVSRQSVSKWESTNSIPDLKKIILLAQLFDVTTDYLLKDDHETIEPQHSDIESNNVQINIEQATQYVDDKIAVSSLNTIGAILCVCSVIPLFFFLAMAETGRLGLSDDAATAIGIVSILLLVALAVSFFIKTNQYKADIAIIDNNKFDLAYGVHSIFQEKLNKFRPTYNLKLSVGIFLFISSSAPLIIGSIFINGSGVALLMLIVLILMIATGIYLVAPAAAKYEAFNNILKENMIDPVKSKREKRAGKFAAFYWPLLVAIYLGWSLWTMNWGLTWIIWPVGAVLFAALVGLMELLDKED